MKTSDCNNAPMERRRHARTGLRMALMAIRLDPDCDEVIDTLHMTDISRGGIGAVSDRPFYPGQRILLCLPLSAGGGRRRIYATITRCRQGDEGYRIGMEFDTVSVGAWCGVSTSAVAAAA